MFETLELVANHQVEGNIWKHLTIPKRLWQPLGLYYMLVPFLACRVVKAYLSLSSLSRVGWEREIDSPNQSP